MSSRSHVHRSSACSETNFWRRIACARRRWGKTDWSWRRWPSVGKKAVRECGRMSVSQPAARRLTIRSRVKEPGSATEKLPSGTFSSLNGLDRSAVRPSVTGGPRIRLLQRMFSPAGSIPSLTLRLILALPSRISSVPLLVICFAYVRSWSLEERVSFLVMLFHYLRWCVCSPNPLPPPRFPLFQARCVCRRRAYQLPGRTRQLPDGQASKRENEHSAYRPQRLPLSLPRPGLCGLPTGAPDRTGEREHAGRPASSPGHPERCALLPIFLQRPDRQRRY